MTKYNIFVRYYNDKIGKCVTNETTCQWYSCLEKTYNRKPLGHYLQLEDMDERKLEEDKESLETLYISTSTMTEEQWNRMTAKQKMEYQKNRIEFNSAIYEKLVINSTRVNNPKYDMIFIWAGLDFYTSEDDNINQLYFDRMKRINFTPWFFHSTTSSLRQALKVAEGLVDLYGKDNVEIGKEVPLDQEIDIV